MGLAEKKATFTELDYLESDRNSEHKFEFLYGEMYAMTGASFHHNVITGNLFSIIHSIFKHRNCHVFMADMRVRVSEEILTYPDILIVCGEVQFTDDHLDTVKNPVCIVEVLSDSTEKYDRGGKFQNYRKLDSLQEYILISQNQILVEKYLRKQNDLWEYTAFSEKEKSILFDSIGSELSLMDIYAKTGLLEAV